MNGCVDSIVEVSCRSRNDIEDSGRVRWLKEGRDGGEEAEAVFQPIDHKRAKTRLAVNGRDDGRARTPRVRSCS
ncbi:hypothetical protein ANTPLA_LOCUS9302 [Anthophora plagiata]